MGQKVNPHGLRVGDYEPVSFSFLVGHGEECFRVRAWRPCLVDFVSYRFEPRPDEQWCVVFASLGFIVYGFDFGHAEPVGFSAVFGLVCEAVVELGEFDGGGARACRVHVFGELVGVGPLFERHILLFGFWRWEPFDLRQRVTAASDVQYELLQLSACFLDHGFGVRVFDHCAPLHAHRVWFAVSHPESP